MCFRIILLLVLLLVSSPNKLLTDPIKTVQKICRKLRINNRNPIGKNIPQYFNLMFASALEITSSTSWSCISSFKHSMLIWTIHRLLLLWSLSFYNMLLVLSSFEHSIVKLTIRLCEKFRFVIHRLQTFLAKFHTIFYRFVTRHNICVYISSLVSFLSRQPQTRQKIEL